VQRPTGLGRPVMLRVDRKPGTWARGREDRVSIYLPAFDPAPAR